MGLRRVGMRSTLDHGQLYKNVVSAVFADGRPMHTNAICREKRLVFSNSFGEPPGNGRKIGCALQSYFVFSCKQVNEHDPLVRCEPFTFCFLHFAQDQLHPLNLTLTNGITAQPTDRSSSRVQSKPRFMKPT